MKKREELAAADVDPGAVEQARICDRAQRDSFCDHLAWGIPTFAAGRRRKAGDGYHNALAGALVAWVPDECRRLGIGAVLRPAHPELIEQPEEPSGCAAGPLLVRAHARCQAGDDPNELTTFERGEIRR